MKFISNNYMPTIHFKHFHGRYLLILLTLFAWLPAAMPSWASSPGQRVQRIRQQEEGQMPALYKAKITIESKSLQHIFTAGRKYSVSEETLIIGVNGKEVKLEKMLVPCDAEVSYLFENGVRKVKRIDIRRILEGASWQWVSERPE